MRYRDTSHGGIRGELFVKAVFAGSKVGAVEEQRIERLWTAMGEKSCGKSGWARVVSSEAKRRRHNAKSG